MAETKLLTTEETAARLRVSRASVYALVKARRLRPALPLRKFLFAEAELERAVLPPPAERRSRR